MKILVLGAGGMLGHCLYHHLSAHPQYQVYGTVRQLSPVSNYFPQSSRVNIHEGIDAGDIKGIESIIAKLRPGFVINCIGIIKQLRTAEEAVPCIAINALLPHQLANISRFYGSRIMQISTDCIFDGLRGRYVESDQSNAIDLYGRTKYLGELSSYPHAITVRTSIIGHELNKSLSLVDWFLSQRGAVKGYRRAVYSGFPTAELADIIVKHIIPRPDLHGLYHVSSSPINKFDLLKLIAEAYGHRIEIIADDDVTIDRSMDSSRFRSATGYSPPSWPDLISTMHRDYIQYHKRQREALTMH